MQSLSFVEVVALTWALLSFCGVSASYFIRKRKQAWAIGYYMRYCSFFWDAYHVAKDAIKPRQHNRVLRFVQWTIRMIIFSGMVIAGPLLLVVVILDYLAVIFPSLRHKYDSENLHQPVRVGGIGLMHLGESGEGHEVYSGGSVAS